MNITKKIIITDTNIITDLNNANILDEFVKIDNVYMSDIVKNDEINLKTCDAKIIKKIKTISVTSNDILETNKLSQTVGKLSTYDLINFVIAKNNDYILATGDDALKKYAERNGVEVFRTLKLIKLRIDNDIISCEKALEACISLKNAVNTRIPKELIDTFIKDLEKVKI